MSEFSSVVRDGASTILGKIRRFFLYLLLVAAVGGGIYLFVCNLTYSKGQRSGYLTKISRKGVLFKTYEGQLNLGGISTNDEAGLTGNLWSFSVWNDKVYEELQKYDGERVTLHYRQKFKGMPWQGKTDYFVYEVKPKGQQSPSKAKD